MYQGINNADEDCGRNIASLERALTILINEFYPYTKSFSEELYTLEDVVHQLIFEIINKEYDQYAPKKTIMDFLGDYDVDGSNRKYTRAIQYAQHYRDYDNKLIEDTLGMRVPELEAQDMSGSNVFKGHQFTAREFLGFKLQAECGLLNKFHEKQIESSKKVSESRFRELFDEYAKKIDELEPSVNEPANVICNTYVYYGTETHFLTEFLYRITLAAEEAGLPEECPVNRIITVCSITSVIPDTFWCPAAFFANFPIIPKWQNFCSPIYFDNEEEWGKKAFLVRDCKHIKTFVLQKGLDKFIEIVHSCSLADKARYIEDHYWIWDNRVEYEWTPERIRYYRKLHAAIMRDFPKPHIR